MSGAIRARRCCSSPITSTRRWRWPTASWCSPRGPGRIKTIVPIDLPRPRNLFSREAEALRIQLTDLLRDEVDRAFAEQEALAAAV